MSCPRAISCSPWSILALVAVGTAAHAQGAGGVAIAVSYFENTSKKADYDPLAKGFADMLITDLAQSSDLTVVERGRLNAILDEVKRQKNPYFDERTAVKLGRGLGAAYIVTGAFLVSKRTLRLDVRVVDVATGTIVLTVEQRGRPDAFFDIEQAAAKKLLDGLGAKLTLVEKKRLGSSGTRDLGAFRAYSDALDARDRGDPKAEREALRRALAADPGYAKVKDRLAALESKVAALEKSGGRIIDPTRAHEFLHNARIQKSEGDYKGARTSLERAIGLSPQLIDPWLALADIAGGKAVAARNESVKLSRPLTAIVGAFGRGDDVALHAALTARGGKHRLHAAAFLFALLAPDLPGKRMDAYTLARDATAVLLEAEQRGGLEAAFVDHLPLLKAAREASSRYFGPTMAAQIAEPARVTITNAHAIHKPTSWWDVRITLYERPKTLPSLTIAKHPSHPHWQQNKFPPRRKDQIHSLWRRASKATLDAIERAQSDPTRVVYRFDDRYEDHGSGGPVPGLVKFGSAFQVPKGELRCQENGDVVTGALCWIDLQLFKPSMAPGPYRVTLSYSDPGDRAVSREVEAWIFEFTKIRHRRVLAGPGISIYGPPEREVIFLHPSHNEALEKHLLGTNKFKVAAEAWIKSYVGNIDVYFDFDFALLGGKRPGEGHRKWIGYRDRIIRKGHHVRMDRGENHLPIPDLGTGVHWLCMASVHDNGARSPEAECHRLEIQKH